MDGNSSGLGTGSVDGMAVPSPARTLLPPLVIALSLHVACIFTFTFPHKRWPGLLRLFLGPLALWACWYFGHGRYRHYDPLVSIQIYPPIATLTWYGCMHLAETFIIMNDMPPKWISLRTEKPLPLPQGTMERVVYALDLLTSVSGSSWMGDRRWNFAPSRTIRYQPPTRTVFVVRAIVRFIVCQLITDVIDTYIKQLSFKTTLNRPVSDALPGLDQVLCSVAIGTFHFCNLSSVNSLLSIVFVTSGMTSPSSWPPFFDNPFLSSSLQDFWSNRWHHLFRRSFTHLGDSLLSLFFPDNVVKSPKGMVRALRVTLTFVMSTLLHLLIMYRLPADPAHPHRYFLDWSIMVFFLIQPVGLAIDACIAWSGLTSGWRRVFAWGFLLWTSRWWADVYVKKGLWDPTEQFVIWSPVRGILFGDWRPSPVPYKGAFGTQA